MNYYIQGFGGPGFQPEDCEKQNPEQNIHSSSIAFIRMLGYPEVSTAKFTRFSLLPGLLISSGICRS